MSIGTRYYQEPANWSEIVQQGLRTTSNGFKSQVVRWYRLLRGLGQRPHNKRNQVGGLTQGSISRVWELLSSLKYSTDRTERIDYLCFLHYTLESKWLSKKFYAYAKFNGIHKAFSKMQNSTNNLAHLFAEHCFARLNSKLCVSTM